jgi:Spy/CpxP family protein refolding chaperone
VIDGCIHTLNTDINMKMNMIDNRTLRALAAGLLMTGALAAAALAGAAPVPADGRAALEAARADLRAGRTQLFADNLHLTQGQADRFWPLYREYDSKRAALGDERIAIIEDYAAAYPNVGDAKAAELVARSIKLEREVADLRIDYAGKFGKVLAPAALLQFLQIDRRVDAVIEMELQRVIPLVEPPAK